MAVDFGDIIAGAARSDNINTDGLVIDMEAVSHLLNPNSAVFEALTRLIGGKKATTQTKHELREKRLIPNYCTIGAAAVVGATTLTIADYDRINTNFILFVPSTEERLLVVTKPSSSTVTVCRLSGSGGIENAIANGATIQICGEAHAEGEEVPAAFSNLSVSKYFYVMQKDVRVQVTDIEEAIEHYGVKSADEQRRDGMIGYRRDMNILGYVGKGSREVVSASGPRRHVCSGLLELCTENPCDLSASGGKLELQTIAAIMSQTTAATDSGSKTLIVGANAQAQISAWPVQQLQEVPGEDKRWGIKINKVITGFGTCEIVFDKNLNANNGLSDRAFLLDLNQIEQLYLQGLPVRYFMDIKNLSSIHSKVDAISGTFGYQLKFPELHSAIKGIA